MICSKVMGEDKSEKLSKDEKRRVLGDITNHLGKRGFSSISSSSGPASKSGNVNKKIAQDPNTDDGDAHFWKQVALVVENIENERCTSSKCPKSTNETGLSPLKGGKIYRLQTASGDSSSIPGNAPIDPRNVAYLIKEPADSALDTIVLDEGEGEGEGEGEDEREGEGGGEGEGEGLRNVASVDEPIKESSIHSVTVADSSKSSQSNSMEAAKEGHGEETVDNACTQESLAAKAESSRSTESRDMRSFGLERCTALTGESCGDLTSSLDLLKSCSCSFCTKAAYIWSDLHYQDVKGRMSVLAKSQKEASNLAQRYSGENETGRHGQGHSSKSPNEGPDLTNQWKSLFHHMQNIFESESSQLEGNFIALKHLREEYKTDLEMINGKPSEVQPCSSDASDHMTT